MIVEPENQSSPSWYWGGAVISELDILYTGQVKHDYLNVYIPWMYVGRNRLHICLSIFKTVSFFIVWNAKCDSQGRFDVVIGGNVVHDARTKVSALRREAHDVQQTNVVKIVKSTLIVQERRRGHTRSCWMTWSVCLSLHTFFCIYKMRQWEQTVRLTIWHMTSDSSWDMIMSIKCFVVRK